MGKISNVEPLEVNKITDLIPERTLELIYEEKARDER